MSGVIDGINSALSSWLGILLSVMGIVGGLVTGLKFLDSKFEDKIESTVDKKLAPLVTDIMAIKNCMELNQSTNETALKYINRALDHIHNIHNDDDMNSGPPL